MPGRKGSSHGTVKTAGRDSWDEIGAPKAWLGDDLLVERNRYARSVVKDVEARKGKAGQWGEPRAFIGLHPKKFPAARPGTYIAVFCFRRP